jgi:hypothetical protein
LKSIRKPGYKIVDNSEPNTKKLPKRGPVLPKGKEYQVRLENQALVKRLEEIKNKSKTPKVILES